MISISHIDSILREEKITNTSIRMNYEDVEAKIVERFSVALEGWPASCGKVRNPGNIGPKKDLICLANALTSDKCRWVKLTEEELEDRKGENERCQQPESGGQQRTRPNVLPALFAVRAEEVKNGGQGPRRPECDHVAHRAEKQRE